MFQIVDAHHDLAYSALNFQRDLRRPLRKVRAAEAGRRDLDGTTTVTIPALLEGGVGLVLGSLFAMPAGRGGVYANVRLSYDDSAPQAKRQAQAHALAMQQLDWYKRLADSDDRVTLVTDKASLDAVIASHAANDPQLGIVIHMEGADPIREPAEVEYWYEQGLRSIGLAWDDTRYAPGQWRAQGRLPREGYALLERMASLNMLADLTHISEAAGYDLLDAYEGAVVATHANARALVKSDRQLSERQVRLLAERDGVIGIVLYNVFLRQDQRKGEPKQNVTLAHVLAHIDTLCQMTGSAAHVGIGSDLDGGFGREDIPLELDSVVDLPKIAAALQTYGYDAAAIDGIMRDNWLRVLRRVLP